MANYSIVERIARQFYDKAFPERYISCASLTGVLRIEKHHKNAKIKGIWLTTDRAKSIICKYFVNQLKQIHLLVWRVIIKQIPCSYHSQRV